MQLRQTRMRGVAHVDAEGVGSRFEQGTNSLGSVGGRTESCQNFCLAPAPHLSQSDES